MTVTNEVAHGGFRWVTLVSDSQPEVGIVLSQPHAGRSQEDGDALAAILAKGELYPVHFRADVPHALRNPHEEGAIVLVVNSLESPTSHLGY